MWTWWPQVRDAIGPHVALRVDANGAWDVDTAVDTIKRLARYDLELVEQPVASLDDLARVRRAVDVPVAADECVRSLADARRLRALDAADAIVLKQQPLGGVRAALDHCRGGPGARDRLVDDGDVDRYRRRRRACRRVARNFGYACGLGHAVADRG